MVVKSANAFRALAPRPGDLAELCRGIAEEKRLRNQTAQELGAAAITSGAVEIPEGTTAAVLAMSDAQRDELRRMTSDGRMTVAEALERIKEPAQ